METKQNLISFTVLFENFFGYNEKKSMEDLHQLIKHKIFNGNWDEFRSNWSSGLDMYDKIIDGINTYEEGFERVVKILKELPLPDDSKKSFLELTLEMYHETSPTSGVIESEINDENQINKQHPNYSKFKIFEYLSNALGDDIVLNFLINNKPKTSQSSIDGQHQIHIDDSDFTLWEVSFEISKNYEEEEYSFEEAKLDFLEKVGSDALEEEEDIDPSSFILTTEIQYYACDSGHGGNIINDCLLALKEDSPGYNDFDYDYKWNKLNYKDFPSGEEINIALDISTQKEVYFKEGYLIGEDLSIVWDGFYENNDYSDITDLIAKGLHYLEKNYDVDFDEIDTWEPDEAYEYVSELLVNNPDDNELKDLQTNLDSISTEDFVLSVEKYSEL